MLHLKIPIAQTNLYPKLVLDYINQVESLKPFYEYLPNINSFEEVIKNKQFEQTKRDILVDALLKQYAKIGIDKKQAKAVYTNIEALKEANTFTITTGHQLALFTGPLFFIYKIISTIRLAQELQLKNPDKKFVPVFWMASEDHDFAEINHVFVNGNKITWDINSNNQPVGVLNINEIKQAINALKAELGENNALIEIFENAYTNSQNLSEATQKIVHHLFADYGLVIIEPNAVELKKQLTQTILNDVLTNTSYQALNDTNNKLNRNYKLQLSGREVNFFYLSQEGRNLLKKTKSGFEINNTSIVFSDAEMEAEIKQHPERFSPNVVLRPVYQEAVLPNLAYIGGPGEVAYWLQLKGVFNVHNTPFPMLVLRNSVLLLPKAFLHKLNKRKVAVEQLFLKEEELIKQFLQTEYPLTIDEETVLITQIIQQAIDKLVPFDNKIASTLIDWKLNAGKQLAKFKQEINQAKKQKSDADIKTLLAIKNNLFPNNQPQERYNTLAQHTGNYYKSFIELVTKQIAPLSNTVDVIFWD